MALLEDLLEGPETGAFDRPGGKLDLLLFVLPEEDEAALRACLGDSVGYPASWLSQTLKRHGHNISATTIKTWRQREDI